MTDPSATGRDEPLVVCVPNFSEGRRETVIDAICDALAGEPGARLAYRQADAEHHRLDTTVVGDPDAVRRSAMAGAAKAVELIDMTQHAGGHPRMGAADVIPFVPLRGVSMEEVVELARGFAKELAETLDLPVYLYDRAALSTRAARAWPRFAAVSSRDCARPSHGANACPTSGRTRSDARGDRGGSPQAARGVQPVPDRDRGGGEGDRDADPGVERRAALRSERSGSRSPNAGASPSR